MEKQTNKQTNDQLTVIT